MAHKAVVAEHYDKFANPSKRVSDWDDLPEWRQERYLNGWRDDIDRNEDLADIMKGILQERGAMP